jgi:hypothetical protein
MDLGRHHETRVLELLRSEYSDPAQVAYLTDRFGYCMFATLHYSLRARFYFFAARIVVIGSGALLPAVITLQSQSHGTAHTWLTASAIALSVLVAITTGLLQASRMDRRWKLQHWGWIRLCREGWALAERRGAYADKEPEARFTTFVDRIEAVLQAFEATLSTLTADGSDEPSTGPSLPPGDNVIPLPK